jgi:hypothetical protein
MEQLRVAQGENGLSAGGLKKYRAQLGSADSMWERCGKFNSTDLGNSLPACYMLHHENVVENWNVPGIHRFFRYSKRIQKVFIDIYST